MKARFSATFAGIVAAVFCAIPSDASLLAVYNNSARSGTSIQLFDASSLTPLSSFAVPSSTGGIAFGAAGSSIYLNYLGVLAQRDLDGSLLRSVIFGTGLDAEDVSFANGTVFASYHDPDSTIPGFPNGYGLVAVADPQLSTLQPRLPDTYAAGGGISAGTDSYYHSYGAFLLHYSLSTGELITFTQASGNITFQDISFNETKLFAASQTGVPGLQGIAVFSSNLTSSTSFLTPAPVQGVAAGVNDDVYVTFGNEIRRYASNGVLLNSYTGEEADQFGDIAFTADVPEPSTAALMGIGALLLTAAARRRTIAASGNARIVS